MAAVVVATATAVGVTATTTRRGGARRRPEFNGEYRIGVQNWN